MLGQVVDGARLEARRLALNPQPIDVGVVVKEEARKARRVYKDNSIRTDIPDSLPLVVADGRRVAQIIATLLSNAAVFSPASSTIRATARHRGERVVLAVADHGLGLSEEERHDVFQKYFQTERSRAVRREGFGVSLAIAKALATELGGDLWVESPGPDRGSTFFFGLPVPR
jgi:signal transduction histidine kinase